MLYGWIQSGGHGCYNPLCPVGSGIILVSHEVTPGLLTKHNDFELSIIKGSFFPKTIKDITLYVLGIFKYSMDM